MFLLLCYTLQLHSADTSSFLFFAQLKSKSNRVQPSKATQELAESNVKIKAETPGVITKYETRS